MNTAKFSSFKPLYKLRVRAILRLQKHELLLLLSILFLGFLAQLNLTLVTDGGTDLVVADVPKIMVFLQGQNPYLTDHWAAPYPPFYFLVLGGLVWASSFGWEVGFQSTVWILRLGLVVAHVLLAALAYLVLRAGNVEGPGRLSVPVLFLFLPSFSHIGEAWFHGDIFGILLLGVSLLLFSRDRWAWGVLSLSLSASFKVHPFLVLPLLIVWFVRRKKPLHGNVAMLLVPFVVLTLLPLWFLPGYSESLISYNTGLRPSWSFTPFVVFYTVLPAYYGLTLPTLLVNQIWVSVTVLIFVAVAFVTWRYGLFLNPLDVVVLGTAAWLLPLRQMYPFYVIWVLVPFALRGRLWETLLVLAPFEAMSQMTNYLWTYYPNWNMSTSPTMVFFSLLSTGLISTSITWCIFFVWRDARLNRAEPRSREAFVQPVPSPL